jgi:Large ribosomal RNA subunit accumulation protein YceD
MREDKTEKLAPAPWRVPVAVEDITEDGQHLMLVADAETRAAIARLAGLRDLPRLEGNFEVRRQGNGGLRVTGQVSATVGQTCVVTLEPLANAVDEDVDLLFMPQAAVPSDDSGEAAAAQGDVKRNDPEPLIGGVVDLGALATEFLILGLDPYPRKPDAVFEAPPNPEPDGGPFASLAGWTRSRDER